jgi:hypothetical protein
LGIPGISAESAKSLHMMLLIVCSIATFTKRRKSRHPPLDTRKK